MSPKMMLPLTLLASGALAAPALPATRTTTSPTAILHARAPAGSGTVTAGNLAVQPWNIYDGVGAGSDTYTTYGCSAAGFPPMSSWVSFVDMFNANKPAMFSSCSSMKYPQADDSGPEVGAIWDGIQQVAAETGLDHRVILAAIMQESGGCVRAATTNGGVRNPGLMQTHDGDGTCNSDYTGQVQAPCPSGVITQMIREGSAGTTEGDGYAQSVNQAVWGHGASDAMAFYTAARLYNSGSVGEDGCLESGGATHCYASDIANRLTGWVFAEKTCWFDG